MPKAAVRPVDFTTAQLAALANVGRWQKSRTSHMFPKKEKPSSDLYPSDPCPAEAIC